MALNNDAVLTAAKGYIFTAPVGTAAPTPAEVGAFTDGTALDGWDNLGHTARDELPEFGFDGGDTETRGTWQAESLREVTTEAAVDYVTFNAHQFDPDVLELYYGTDNTSSDPNIFGVRSPNSRSQERALLIIIVDGDHKVAFYAPRVSIRREEAISLAVDEFAVLPLRATFLTPTSGDLFQWITGAPEEGPAA